MNQHTPLPSNYQHILIVEDHETVLNGTLLALKTYFPGTEFHQCTNVDAASKKLRDRPPDLLLVDLSLPFRSGEQAEPRVGIDFLRQVMGELPDLNIVVHSSHTRDLTRLIHEIEGHAGGFTVASKSLSIEELVSRIRWALDGVTYTKDVEGLRRNLAMRPAWLEVLHLGFEEGLQDKAIAQRMHVAERTVRLYWTKIYDVLELYPDEERNNNRNIRIQALNKARQFGLID